MAEQPLILIVEDDLPLGQVYSAFLKQEGYRVRHVGTGQEALQSLQQEVPDVLLLDLLLPDMHGQEVLEGLQSQSLPTATIVVTTEASTDAAVNAIKAGAVDYLVKPLDQDRLCTTVGNAQERVELTRRLSRLQGLSSNGKFEGLIGDSPAMQVVYRIIDNAAGSEASVFITGESGTGKELCAEAIHRRSRRASGPFVAVNCAAIPHDLMESELFGHVKGAFTGASSSHRGAAAQADHGTLFFDEICEMDLELQAKLLRFVQTRQFQPLGAGRTESTDVRFVCATNRDPWIEVQAGRFREDLYYRLYVVPIEMPALRERDGDVLMLARHFLDQFAGEMDKRFEACTAEAEQRLLSYAWPGNVRELQNAMHNLAVLHPGGPVRPEMLQLLRADATPKAHGDKPASDIAPVRPLWEEERNIIERAIRFCDGNVAEAAKLLGISDSTIYRKRQRWV